MALHVLDHHDGVVDHQSGGQRNAEQGERVDGEAEDLDKGEGADQRDRNGDGRDDRRSPVLQEQEDHDDHDENRFDDRRSDFLDGVGDHGRGVDSDHALHARRELFLQVREHGQALALHVQRVGVGELLNAETDGLATLVAKVELEVGVVVFGPHFRMAYVAQQHQTAIGGAGRVRGGRGSRRSVFQDDVVELVGIGKPADDAHRHGILLAIDAGRLAELTGGYLNVLLLEGVLHIKRGEATRGQLRWIEPDAHGVLALAEDDDSTHTRNALECVADVDVKVVADKGLRQALVGREEARGQNEVAVGLGDADTGVVDRGGKPALCGGNAVLHVDCRNRQVIASLEGDGDGAGAVVGAGGRHVAHAFHTVDRGLQRNGDGRFDSGRVGADVVAGDHHLGRRKLRVQRDRNRRDRHGTGKHDQKRANGGKDGSPDEELNHEALSCWKLTNGMRSGVQVARVRYPSGLTGMPSCIICRPETITLSPGARPPSTG